MKFSSLLLLFFVLSGLELRAGDEIMPLSQVKRGMVGVARTIFEGTEIEEFGVEVLGVLPNLLGPKQDIILARLLGDKVVRTGVVAGMSGSPVYIDGKLAGSISLRFGIFTKEPIAGITPIENMLRRSLRQPPRAEQSIDRKIEPLERAWLDPSQLRLHMVPIKTPLVFSGFAPEVIERFAPAFERYNCLAIAGGSGSSQSAADLPLVPGAAVAAQLMRGDMSIAATGTITYRDGNRLLAFGHPFLNFGPVDMPMAGAEIIATLSSDFASFKISRTTGLIGRIRHDGMTAVEGIIGQAPEMIPASIQLRPENGPPVKYQVQLFQNKLLTPLLLQVALVNSIFSSPYYSQEATIELDGRIKLKGYPEVRLRDLFTGGSFPASGPGPMLALTFKVSAVFEKLFNNPLDPVEIEAIELNLKPSHGTRSMEVERLWTARREARPGEKVAVKVFLKPYRGEIMVREIDLTIPPEAQKGKLFISIGSAAGIEPDQGKTESAQSLSELIRSLNRIRPNNHLYVVGYQKLPGAIVGNTRLPALPASILSVISSQRAQGDYQDLNEALLFEERLETEYVIVGNKSLELVVN